ncbi:MAG: hypothetical protein KDD45_01045, partial [Bdellovibrionales bacterium]|nr:hypothetical protein [Bdellovibrionales bacterium]
EITLGPLPLKDVSLLLKLANNRFSLADRYFITNVAGGHPYLVQLAAYELWETHYKGVKDEKERRQLAGEEIYRKASDIISSTWRYWAPTKRQAFTTICLAHMSVLEKGSEMLESRYFNLDELFKGMRDFRQEISQLRLNGFIMEDSSVPGGWRVCPTAFLWWVADEIVRSVRVETTFENWLQKQEWDGLLTKGEKELLKTTMLSFGELVKDGVNTLVEITSTLKK